MAEITLELEEKVKTLVRVSRQMSLSADEILALYLVLGDRIFFVFDLFQGKTVRFPSTRSFRQYVSASGTYRIQKLKRTNYAVNGGTVEREKIKRGDLVTVSGVEFESLGSPMEIFGETYIICKERKDGK